MSHITLEETLLYEMVCEEAKKRKNLNDERKSIENKKQVKQEVKASSSESAPTDDAIQKRLAQQGELNRRISMAAQRKKAKIMKRVDDRAEIGQTFNNTPDHRVHKVHHINGIF